MSHGTCDWVMAHVIESWHIWLSHGTYEDSRVNDLWHIWVSGQMNHGTCDWVMAHTQKDMEESRHKKKWMSARLVCGKSAVTCAPVHMRESSHINESCHILISCVTYEGVISHMDESCHIWMSHVTHINESCHIWNSHVTHMNESCGMQQVGCDMHAFDMTHSYVSGLIHMWHVSFMCVLTYSYVTWPIHMWHNSFTCDVTHSYVT